MLLGRPRHRWEGNIKMHLKETGRQSLGWIYLAQDTDQKWDHVILSIICWESPDRLSNNWRLQEDFALWS
jgi:hypothetical protein